MVRTSRTSSFLPGRRRLLRAGPALLLAGLAHAVPWYTELFPR